MKRLLAIGAVVLAIITLAATIICVGYGCPMLSSQPYGPKVTGDGSGGAITVYEYTQNGGLDIYAQKISPDGKPAWGDRGIFLGHSHSQFYSFFNLHIVSDGSGGAIIAWPELPSEQKSSITHVARLDSKGNMVWRKAFESVYHMISDSAGGVIVAAVPGYEGTIVLHRIGPLGNSPWGEKGIPLSNQGNARQIAGDGTGGVVVVRQELEYQAGSEPGNARTQGRIYAQRIDSQGKLSWGLDGILLYTTGENVYIEESHIIGDGSGGAIATWHQWPSGKIEEGMPEAFLNDFRTQKVAAEGNTLWQPDGVPLEIVKAAGGFFPVFNPLLISDGAGGAIIVWEDMRKGLASIYAQRIGADGAVKWQPEGVEVCYIKSNASFIFRQIVSDGQGGALISCRFKNAENGNQGILVQRLNSGGGKVWPGNGIVATDSGTSGYSIASDGQGGVIVVWGIDKAIFRSEKAYVQRIDSEGRLIWGDKGIQLNP